MAGPPAGRSSPKRAGAYGSFMVLNDRLRPPPPVTPPPPGGLVIAHRGGLAHAPENSLAAIRVAALRGADAVELDVRLHRGRLVCAHDRGQDGPDAAEALGVALALGLRVELDLKSAGADGAPERVVRLLDDAGAHTRAWVSTFHPLTAWRLRHADPRVVVGWSIARSPVQRLPLAVGWARWLGVQIVAPEHGLLTRGRIAAWHGTGLVVEAWGLPRHAVPGCLELGLSVVVDHVE